MRNKPLIEFVTAFVESCYDSGMSKEGAAIMLQGQLLERAMGDPHFQAGFEKVAMAHQVPGYQPPGHYTANQWSFGDQTGQNTAGYGLGGAGVGAMIGNKLAKTFKGRLPTRLRWAGRLGALGGLAGAGFGAKKDMDIRNNRWVGQIPGGVPSASMWDGKAEYAAQQNKFQQLSQGVAGLNTVNDARGKRMAELKAAIDANAPGADVAMSEYERLSASPVSRQRDQYFSQLGDHQGQLTKSIDDIQRQQQDLERAKASPWSRFRNFIRRPVDYSGEASRLKGEESRYANDLRMNQGLTRRLAGGYTGGNPEEVMEPEDLERRMFPTQ